MMDFLLINAHPEPTSDTFSHKLQDYFIHQLKQYNPDIDLTILNLAHQDIPRLDKEMLNLFNQQIQQQTLSAEQLKLQHKMQAILTQFKAHKRIIITLPLHNFNIPSILKDYMDNILIARETFKYTESGSVGLINDDRKIFVLQSSGSIYTQNDRYTPLEFSQMYLKEMFCNIMGFNAFFIARVQGTSIRLAKDVLADGFTDIDNQFIEFMK